MDQDQFNELLAYTMIVAVNTAATFQQAQRMRALTVEEIDQCQKDVMRSALGIKESLAARNPAHDWAPLFDVPPFGRSDT